MTVVPDIQEYTGVVHKTGSQVQDGDDFYASQADFNDRQTYAAPSVATQSVRAPSPPPGPILDHSHLRPGNQAALLSHERTLELYRANAKKTQDPDLQFEIAVFMIESMTRAIPEDFRGNDPQRPNSARRPLDPQSAIRNPHFIFAFPYGEASRSYTNAGINRANRIVSDIGSGNSIVRARRSRPSQMIFAARGLVIRSGI